MFFNRLFLLLILVISVGFFNIKYLSLSQIRLIQFIMVGLMLVGVLARFFYGTQTKREKKFTLPIIFILTGVFLSSITAYVYHHQGFFITFWAQAPMYWFVFYFFLSVNNYGKEELEKYLLIFAVLYSIIYVIQFFLYPTILFDVRIDDDPARNTIRIFLSGSAFLVIGYYLMLNKFFNTNKLIYLLPIMLFFVVTVLQASRQHVFSMLVVTLYAIIFTRRIKSRGLIIFFITVSIIPLFYIFQDVINSLVELSTSATKGTDASANARERALKFFLNDFFPSNSAYILGNGADHMRSPYGLKMTMLRSFHFYLSDLGLIGEYIRYGMFFLVGAILIIVKLIRSKTPPELNYIKYYALSILILIPLASSFTSASSIAVLCIIFYLLDLESGKKNKISQLAAGGPKINV